VEFIGVQIIIQLKKNGVTLWQGKTQGTGKVNM
jgi:hypothetical protein